MPGHWLLARMGKRVLRPGLELTQRMLDALDIRAGDDVVEFVPGLGVTARAALERGPRSYVGIEQDEGAADHVRRQLRGANRQCVVGSAEKSGLPAASASVVYGEAMLTMQTAKQCGSTRIAVPVRGLAGGDFPAGRTSTGTGRGRDDCEDNASMLVGRGRHLASCAPTSYERRAMGRPRLVHPERGRPNPCSRAIGEVTPLRIDGGARDDISRRP